MMIFHACSLLVIAAAPADVRPWVEAAKQEGITVYAREREGSSIREVKAIGVIDATPDQVWKAVRDYPAYPKTMPYVEVSEVVSIEQEGKLTYLYSVVNAPLVERRDYTIKLTDVSDWKEGKGYLMVRWEAASDKGPPEKKGLVRVKLNDGHWKLEPRDGGTKTFVTYYLLTEPGGSIPNWIINRANTTAVPSVFAAVRKVVGEARR